MDVVDKGNWKAADNGEQPTYSLNNLTFITVVAADNLCHDASANASDDWSSKAEEYKVNGRQLGTSSKNCPHVRSDPVLNASHNKVEARNRKDEATKNRIGNIINQFLIERLAVRLRKASHFFVLLFLILDQCFLE